MKKTELQAGQVVAHRTSKCHSIRRRLLSGLTRRTAVP